MSFRVSHSENPHWARMRLALDWTRWCTPVAVAELIGATSVLVTSKYSNHSDFKPEYFKLKMPELLKQIEDLKYKKFTSLSQYTVASKQIIHTKTEIDGYLIFETRRIAALFDRIKFNPNNETVQRKRTIGETFEGTTLRKDYVIKYVDPETKGKEEVDDTELTNDIEIIELQKDAEVPTTREAVLINYAYSAKINDLTSDQSYGNKYEIRTVLQDDLNTLSESLDSIQSEILKIEKVFSERFDKKTKKTNEANQLLENELKELDKKTEKQLDLEQKKLELNKQIENNRKKIEKIKNDLIEKINEEKGSEISAIKQDLLNCNRQLTNINTEFVLLKPLMDAFPDYLSKQLSESKKELEEALKVFKYQMRLRESTYHIAYGVISTLVPGVGGAGCSIFNYFLLKHEQKLRDNAKDMIPSAPGD